jgi:hypothetical protein
MSALFLLLAGFSLELPTPEACHDALHLPRTQAQLEIAGQATAGDVLVYTLIDQAKKKTAQPGCQLD